VPYDFFLSYPRAVESPVLKKFVEDLHDAVRNLRGLSKGSRVGFLDATDLLRGTDWPADIRDALQTAKTMVSMYCPAYFVGGFCEAELRIFEKRQQLYQQSSGHNPRAIKPIPWIVPFKLPADLGHLQYEVGGEEAIEKQGLEQVLKNKRKYLVQYNDFMKKLAEDIVKTADAHALPQLDDLVFPGDDAPSTAQEGESDSGPGHVRFVYLAPRQNQMLAVRKALDFYGPGPKNWKPFLPDLTKGIAPLVQTIAGEYDFSSDELLFTDALPDDIRAAEKRGNLVVILVDGWSLRIDGYRAALTIIDERRFFNTSIVVPWNLKDQETASNFKLLSKAIRNALMRWSSEGNAIRYNDEVKSPEDLRKHLVEALTRLKAEVLNTIATDHPPGLKPVISATGGGSI
jgi:FxsC-like protein